MASDAGGASGGAGRFALFSNLSGSGMKRLVLRAILFVLPKMLEFTARRHPAFRERLKQHDVTAWFGLVDESIGATIAIRSGKVFAQTGSRAEADVALVFQDVYTALVFLMPGPDQGEIIHAAKNFKVVTVGRDDLLLWFTQTLNMSQTVGTEMGVKMRDGGRRYTTCTNGGPIFVYVKGGKILRTTPIDFDDKDAASWEIEARGKRFRPKRGGLVAPHALSLKSQVYSDKRILYPMKRVDFDPDGERNPQNRGKSGYVRISWDEAFDIVAKEINRQKRVHGPGSITFPMSSHHQWGNVGYYLSSLTRFANLIGFTRVVANPDSWEGWYWGAMHHFGNAMRIGVPAGGGTMADCLKEAEMVVFWSCDPESTNGAYAGFEGTQHRMWARELGIEFVHIDPHFSATAQLLGGRWIPIRPQTDAALAIAIMYVWVVEGLYDKDYVATRTTGFDEWKAYLLGETDGVPKTPEWQEAETGVPAKDARALARKWGGKKVHLAIGMTGAGFGGAGRGATGQQWARGMIMIMAMQGWGKLGVNFGSLQMGAPIDPYFYFPGYADGGISGDLLWTGNAVHNYQRMPHVLTMNHVRQMVPRQQLPDAIINGHATGYLWDGMSQEAQFAPFTYPMPGYSPIHMIYRYGGSSFSTVTKSGRWVEAYRHESIEFVVNQSVWMEGEAQFADVILPACTSLERWDIGEWSNAGGYAVHGYYVLNHRVVTLQHKCIEPLGESRSDYDIFCGVLAKLGLGSHVCRRRARSRLGQARVRFLRPAETHLLERFLPEGILRRSAGRVAGCRYALVCGRPEKGYPGAGAAAQPICGRIRQRPANAERQTGICPRTFQAPYGGQSRPTGGQSLPAFVGRAARDRASQALSAPDDRHAQPLQLPYIQRWKEQRRQSDRGPSRLDRRPSLLAAPAQPGRRRGERHSASRSGENIQRPRRRDLCSRHCVHGHARRREVLRGERRFPADRIRQ